ncbi:MAG: MBL fold metallo-hydrolase [bacterium]
MNVTFWGVRGSLPCPLTQSELLQKARLFLQELRLRGLPSEEIEERFLASLPQALGALIGGNTSCVEVEIRGKTLIFDAGTGIRQLGDRLMEGACGRGAGKVRIFLSHTHWDHIQGLPFFRPLYIKGNRIEFYSGFKDVQPRLEMQQRAEFFPVPLSSLDADIHYHWLPPDRELDLALNGEGTIRVRVYRLNHPGDAFAYRLETDAGVLVYASDADCNGLKQKDLDGLTEFFRNADLLIFDSQFTFKEYIVRREWGHASAIIGVNIAQQAGVKKLALFHHSSDYPDPLLYDILEEARAYKRLYFPESPLDVILASEGLLLTLGKSAASNTLARLSAELVTT